MRRAKIFLDALTYHFLGPRFAPLALFVLKFEFAIAILEDRLCTRGADRAREQLWETLCTHFEK